MAVWLGILSGQTVTFFVFSMHLSYKQVGFLKKKNPIEMPAAATADDDDDDVSQ